VLVAAIENLFVPVLIYTSQGTAHDAAMLKEFNEPAWNNPVARIIDTEKKDIIERINGVYNARGVATRMLQALEKAGVELEGEARAVLQKVADGKETSAEEARQFKDAISGRVPRQLDKALSSAVTAYESRKFSKAAELAAKVRDDEKAEPAARADAEYLINLVDGRFNELKAKAEKLKGEREYDALFALVDEAESAFKGMSGAGEFFAAFDELKKDKAVKEELKALEKLAKLEEKLKGARNDSERDSARKALKDFAEKNPGTRAAEKAEASAAK